jgi:hypothetical protein
MTARLEAATTADAVKWRTLLPAGCSAFGSLEFARIMERHRGYRPRLLIFTEGDTLVVYPTLLRPVSELSFTRETETTAWDSVSPEYTGPLARGPVTPEAAHHFRALLAEYCERERVVAEFGHLHPFHRCANLVPAAHEFVDRDVAYVDLRLSQEELWHDSFTHACRKNVSRARAADVRVAPAATEDDIREFHRIYAQTMQRRGARARYGFPLSYFMAFFREMPENATFLLAHHGGRVVAGTLYLHDDDDVYSYLGGADQAFQQVRPTNAVVYEAIRWAQRHQKRRLILGGGYQPDDGIFRFKASFSPLRASFHVYRCVQMPEEYARLCGSWAAYYGPAADPGGFFPVYRAVPVGMQDDDLGAS